MSFSFSSKKELTEFLRSCSNIGIKELTIDGVTVAFYPPTPKPDRTGPSTKQRVTIPVDIEVSEKATRAADEIERQAQENLKQQDIEQERMEALVLDPEDFENSIVEDFADGNASAESSEG